MADPRLKAALEAGRFVVAPGIFDMVSAKIAPAMVTSAVGLTSKSTG